MSDGRPEPPATARVVLLIARLAWLRVTNRLGNLWVRRAAPGQRSATPRKKASGRLLLAFMALIFGWQTVTTSARLLQRVARLAEQREHPGVVILDADAFALFASAAELRASADGASSEASEASDATARASAEVELERALDHAAGRDETDPDVAARRAELRRVFEERGVGGFEASVIPNPTPWPDPDFWYSGADPRSMLKPLALVAFLLGLAQMLQHVAGSDDDLAKVGPGLEWLFSFPVPARALFLARAASAVFTGPLIWIVLFPFHVVIFACSGFGLLALPVAAGVAIYVGLLGGGLRVLLETTLRRYLSAIWVSRIQAILLTLSLLPLVSGYAVAFSPITSGLLAWASGLPDAVFYLPLTLPLWLTAGGPRAWASAALGLGVVGAWLWLCVRVAERMVRSGITTGGGDLKALRGRGGAFVRPRRATPLNGILLKEWRSMLRDRRLRAQAFIGPLLIFGMQFLLNPPLVRGITQNPRHAATAAFAMAGFSLTTGACTALAAEGPALWLLYTAPRPLERLLLSKLWAWACVACLYALGVLSLVWLKNPALFLPTLPYAALSFAGILVYAVIALGLGTLGTDPLEPEPRRRVRPGSMYLFMLLSSLFAYAIYIPSWWAKLVQLCLSALLAFAMWQKLRDRLPFLLDPTEAPLPTIAVADGVIAALAFFVLQGLFTPLFRSDERAPALTLLLAFVSAGSAVAVLALISFKRSGVPELMRALGLSRAPGARLGVVTELGLGVLAGLAAAVLALGYLAWAQRIPWLASALDGPASRDSLDLEARLGALAVGVLAAPLVEEFIFRGILYRGFRRSVRAPSAALASALVFALVHPAASALPVFVMALLAALAYERSGWLATPIAAHMTYNAIVLGSALL